MPTIPLKRTALVAGAASLLAGVVLWPAGAGAADADDGAGSGEVITAWFVADREEETFLDHDGSRGLSLGDEIVYTNTTKGRLGPSVDHGRCVFQRIQPARDSVVLHCTATSEGRRGSLAFQGTARTSISQPPRLLERAHWAVVGGTGDFQRARGQATLRSFSGQGLDLKTSGRLRLVLAP